MSLFGLDGMHVLGDILTLPGLLPGIGRAWLFGNGIALTHHALNTRVYMWKQKHIREEKNYGA